MTDSDKKLREDIKPDIRPEWNNIRKLESNPEKPDDKSSIKDSEETGSNSLKSSWGNKVTGKSSGPTKGKFSLAGLKKKGPLAAMVAVLFGLVGIGSSFYPVALTQSLYSNLIDKFNIQETSASLRTNRIIARKMSDDITTDCNNMLKITCRFTRPSNRFLTQLEKNGITALDDAGQAISKKDLWPNTRPKSYRFTNAAGDTVEVGAKELYGELAQNPELRNAFRKSSKTRFMSLADDTFEKVRAKFGFSTDNKIADVADDVANAADDVADDVANTLDDSVDDVVGVLDDVADDFVDDAAVAAINSADDAVKATFITNQLSETVTDATKSAAKTGKGDVVTLAASVLCGVADVPGMITKSVRAFQMGQLIKYSALILATFGAIRAGDALPEETNAIGNLLTSPVDGKSAMDSFGVNYVINKDSSPKDDNYKKFVAGASILAVLGGVVTAMNSPIKKTACATMTNPLTGQAINVALAANAPETMGTTLLVAGVSIAAAWGLSELMEYIAENTDIIPSIVSFITSKVDTDKILEYFVGDLTKGLVGEPVGDALVSGASHIMGQTANSGGNMPLTVEQAIAYNEQTKQLQIAYAEEDRATKSPLDISSRYTMMGSFVYNLVPHLVKGYRVAGIATNSITSVASIIFGSFSSLFNPAKVLATDPSQEYKLCEDPEMQENNIAAGPYCNIIYGVPTEYLDKDPYDLAEKLVANGDIDEETGEAIEGSGYKDWLDLCTTGDTYNARNCKVDDRVSDYAVYTIDYRIQQSMDEEPAATVSSSTPGGSTDPGDASQPDNTVASNKGWTFKTDTDYSGIACADGTAEVGVFTTGKHNIKIRVCQMPDGLTKVSSLISKRTLNMINAAKEAGINLKAKGIRSSFRTIDDQMYFREQNCPDPLNSSSSACTPDTALPGSSMHERGLAIDFENSSKGGAVWNWLAENGASYGYFNYPPENWHWSMSGS